MKDLAVFDNHKILLVSSKIFENFLFWNLIILSFRRLRRQEVTVAFRQTRNPVFSSDWMYDMIGELGSAVPAPASLALGEIHLFQGAIIPTPDTLLADLVATEADFDGYAAVVTGPPVRVVSAANQWALFVTAMSVVSGALPITGNTVTGYWYETAAGVLVYSERFGTPVNMGAIGDFLNLDAMIPFNLLVTIPAAA